MDLDMILAQAAPARREFLDGPDSPAATSLYRQITAARPATAPSRRGRIIVFPAAAAAGALAAAATALTLISGSPVTAGRDHTAVRHAALAAAWAATAQPDGLVKVTIRELRDPQGLARKLRADGVPVNVQFIPHPFTGSTGVNPQMPSSCRAPQMSDKANALLQGKITPYVPPGPLVPGTARQSTSDGITTYSGEYINDNPNVVLYIRPSAIPQGIGLSIAAWTAPPGTSNGPDLDLQADLVQATPQCTGS